MIYSEPIVVRFRDYKNTSEAGQEVWVSSSKSLPLELREVEGQEKLVAKLSDLLPVALDASSPIKG